MLSRRGWVGTNDQWRALGNPADVSHGTWWMCRAKKKTRPTLPETRQVLGDSATDSAAAADTDTAAAADTAAVKKKRGDPARTLMVRFVVSQNVNEINTSPMIMHEYTRRHVHVTSLNLT